MKQSVPYPPRLVMHHGYLGKSRQWACADHSDAVRHSPAYSPFEGNGLSKIDRYSLDMYRAQRWLTGAWV